MGFHPDGMATTCQCRLSEETGSHRNLADGSVPCDVRSFCSEHGRVLDRLFPPRPLANRHLQLEAAVLLARRGVVTRYTASRRLASPGGRRRCRGVQGDGFWTQTVDQGS